MRSTMQRRLILMSLALLTLRSRAQDSFSYEVIGEFEMPRDRLFDTSLLWLAETARSSKSVIDLKDKDLGTIIGNASTSLNIAWGTNVPMIFKLRIDVKDNRYRLTFSQVQLNFDYGLKPIEQANRESLEPKAKKYFADLAVGFQTYLVAAAKAKPW